MNSKLLWIGLFFTLLSAIACNNFETFIPTTEGGPDISMSVGIDSIAPAPVTVSDSVFLTASLGDSVHFTGVVSDDTDLESIQTTVYLDVIEDFVSDVTRDSSFTAPDEHLLDFGFRLSSTHSSTYEVAISALNVSNQISTFTVTIDSQ